MKTLFVSDLHLDLSRPTIIEVFEQFVSTEAVNADALFILGDLFEAWIGDDAAGEVGNRFAAALKPMRTAGRPCFFMHGNRDFLLGETYARAAGLTLLPDPAVINVYGTPTLLMHGDSLCIDDVPYQAFRSKARSPTWQREFLGRSVAEREAFAQQARQESQRYTGSEANAGLMDVNQQAVHDTMRRFKIHRLIHGHTHRPATHHFDLDQQPAERIVLGDWYEQGSALVIDDKKSSPISTARFPL